MKLDLVDKSGEQKLELKKIVVPMVNLQLWQQALTCLILLIDLLWT